MVSKKQENKEEFDPRLRKRFVKSCKFVRVPKRASGVARRSIHNACSIKTLLLVSRSPKSYLSTMLDKILLFRVTLLSSTARGFSRERKRKSVGTMKSGKGMKRNKKEDRCGRGRWRGKLGKTNSSRP